MAKRPNILLFFADQLRADALGCYGNPVCQTPHLDALAASGVLFENSFTPNPICVPARASLTTGNYSHRATNGKNNGGRIRDGQPKLAAHFAACGYETYACGKLHYSPYAPPGQPRLLHGFQHCDLTESGRLVGQFDPKCTRRGLEDYIDYLADAGYEGFSRAHGVGNNDVRPCPSPLPAEHHVDAWVATCTIRRMREHIEHRPDKPFLIFSSFPKPHSPYDPPYEYVERYDVRDIPAPVGDAAMLADRNPFLEWTRVTHGIDTLSPAALRVIKMYYYALITHQDAQVGRVMNALEESGAAADTIVVFAADHGDLMGDFGTYFKCSFLEGSVRVPILFAGRGCPCGQRRRQLVGLQDILPTLAAMAGCPLEQEVHGLDITAAIRDDKASVREVYYSQCFDAPRQLAMVFDGRWKYCWAQQGPTEEFYDLAEDPHELTNLASRPAFARATKPVRFGGRRRPDAEALLKPWRERLVAEARKVGDTAILDGDGLASAPLDREAIKKLPISGLGWRWF